MFKSIFSDLDVVDDPKVKSKSKRSKNIYYEVKCKPTELYLLF